MSHHTPQFAVDLARSQHDIRSAQHLRYRVFVQELGGGGDLVDDDSQLERDRFDDHAAHLLLRDLTRPDDDQVVGVYRIMTQDHADSAGQFYCADEFDLSILTCSNKRLLELGRSCLHADYRGGAGMMYLWSGLSDYVAAHKIDVMFGAASFHGTDTTALAGPLSLLYHRHLAPPALRVTARGPATVPLNVVPEIEIDRIAAMRDTPSLIKAYLRLGGCVGDRAYVDHTFNTTDVCMILAADAVSSLQRGIYSRGPGRG